jgi:DinB superfamily
MKISLKDFCVSMMDAADREQILRLIAESDAALVAAVAGVSDEIARRRPEPERWSVLECVEHVVLVEDSVFARISEHSTPGAPPAELRREGQILRGMTKRELKFAAPEFAEPKGRYSSLGEALQEFGKRRARTVAYVEQYQEDPRNRITLHPALGPVSCQEMFLVLALHPARHALQIREARQRLGLE